MTAPTPKPEASKPGESKPEDKAAPQRSSNPRLAALWVSACLVFATFAVALTRLLPAPHVKSDYLVIGSLATLAALITIFAGMVLGRWRR
jgi:hypothetical protein